MRLTRFKVQNYRSINDSQWVDVDDTTVIVGKNESGKTSLLKALWKFNPFKPHPYSLDREWPKGRRKERTDQATVIIAEFAFSTDEQAAIDAVDECTKGITGVTITKNYKGTFSYSFLPKNPTEEDNLKWAISIVQENFGQPPETASSHFKMTYETALVEFVGKARAHGGATHVVAQAGNFKSTVNGCVSPNDPEKQQDQTAAAEIHKAVDLALKELKVAPPARRVVDMAQEWLPTFIYMDDYRIFSGAAQLNEVKQRKDNRQSKPEDDTIILLMEQAGLDLDDEVEKAGKPDREQRILDMNDASNTLTKEIADRWSQKRYVVRFEADGYHFVTFVQDVDSVALVPLEERSKGFQWFFSFDMMFMSETKGEFENAVILLDEPGLHLHAAAQRDLLKRMASYAKNNQLIYTTHLPFMIDFNRLDNIFVCEENEAGTIVHKDWATADKDARFTLQAALGLSWSQSLFVGQYNLVVEGVTDFWLLSTLSTMLREAGEDGLDEQLVVTPAGGASKVAYVGTILHGQELNVMVLLDSDKEGEDARKQLVHEWILKDDTVLMLGKVLGVSHPCALEDLFDEATYLGHVQAAYAKELGTNRIALAKANKPIVERVEEALQAVGVPKFNKGRVAKIIMQELAGKTIGHLPPAVVQSFRQTIAAINAIVAKWKEKE